MSEIHKVAVIGAGTMGHGIAQVSAMAGCDVVMTDIDKKFVDKGLERIAANLEKGVARGKVTDKQRKATLERIAVTTDLDASVSDVDLVVEAAPEQLAIKRALFEQVDAAAPARALLATNTSSLSVALIAAAVKDPSRLIGMHFFNPVHIMKLLEIVHHDGNEPAIVERIRAFAERIGKTPIVVKDVPGFASSRLGIAIGLEAMRMVQDGVASAADIDTAMKLGYGFPMGPLELTDLVGLDVRLDIADYLTEALGPRFTPPQVLRDKVAAGHQGKKTGQGFYTWKDGKRTD